MIRWSYALPRLALFAAAVGFLLLALDPLMHALLVSGAPWVTGAPVEVGSVRTSLWRGSCRLGDVAVADPGRPGRNLLTAADAELVFDLPAAFNRRLVIREARLTGMEIGSPRAACEQVPRCRSAVPGVEGNAVPRDLPWEAALRLLEREVLEELESVRLGRALAERWPVEYRRLEAQALELKQQLEALRQEVRSTESGRVKELLESAAEIQRQLAEIRRRAEELRGEWKTLWGRAREDRVQVAAAAERDLERLRAELKLEQFNPQWLSETLLDEELQGRVAELLEWTHWLAEFAPSQAAPPEPDRLRGWNMPLAGMQPPPRVLLLKAAMDGRCRLAGRPMQVSGTLQDWASEPRRHSRPTLLQLRTHGAFEAQVEARLDLRGWEPRRELVIDAPRLHLPRRMFGDAGRLALDISPGPGHVWLAVRLEGERLEGEIRVRQEEFAWRPIVAENSGSGWLARPLRQAAAEITDLQAVVEISGTLAEPEWRLRSNLGPQLAQAVNRAFLAELAARRESLAAEVEERLARELENFEATLVARRNDALEGLRLDAEIELVRQELSARLQPPENLADRAAEWVKDSLQR